MKNLLFENGDKMPTLGLGTWKSKPNEVYKAVLHAIQVGYRHIDCAYVYKNENEIGQAISDAIAKGMVKREDLWITSKLWNDAHLPQDVLPAIQNTLKDLQLDYLDLYLVHWPVALKKGVGLPTDPSDFLTKDQAPLADTWAEMEKLHKKGLTRQIGVSNFNSAKIEALKANASIMPTVNQVEYHPYLPQEKLKEYCDNNGIYITGYGPLGAAYRVADNEVDHPILLENTVLQEIAAKHSATVAQVVLAWAIEKGVSVVPKSVNFKRIEENFAAANLSLDNEAIKIISNLGGPYRYTHGSAWVGEISPYDFSDIWEECL
ncbi:aldo/keto reductase [Cyclobacterium marinum]|uniref:Aldo/keto reductase n=1 Tax=Cyclobacterium marinum (strain ATCC 25205 / DSM 745 / LMG 13164 / NCIMB 1802) TaxID=880070 RepID=G0IYR5_CYCMS|nr:aldo/keto reductase [Cyclobacterium marinum]AEL27248.1 aldo/keto reductase [Cyclobacterium marinum DSM 745]